MRIDSFTPSTDVQTREVGRTPQTELEQSNRKRSTESAGEDSASISPLAQQLAQALSDDSPEEIARVEQTQQAVEAGNFNVPASEVADSLIGDALAGTAVEQRLGERS